MESSSVAFALTGGNRYNSRFFETASEPACLKPVFIGSIAGGQDVVSVCRAGLSVGAVP